jgi:molecular chaperone GrpE
MSRQHAQVLNMVLKKADGLAAFFGLEMILAEGIPFDPRVHEAVANRTPDSQPLEVLEVLQPGYLQDGQILRPAKVVVGAASDPTGGPEGIKTS